MSFFVVPFIVPANGKKGEPGWQVSGFFYNCSCFLSSNRDNPLKTHHTINKQTPKDEVSDQEMQQVIADFLAMGYVENIVALFKQDQRYYSWTGVLLEDERFAVRLGVSVLFEYLVEEQPDAVVAAIPSLARRLEHASSLVRGEAASVLGIIGTPEAKHWLASHRQDPDPQVRAIIADILEDEQHSG